MATGCFAAYSLAACADISFKSIGFLIYLFSGGGGGGGSGIFSHFSVILLATKEVTSNRACLITASRILD